MNPTSRPITYPLYSEQIQQFLPHAYPFLLLDRVMEVTMPQSLEAFAQGEREGVRVLARKNVSIAEPYFQGHFPGNAVFPGVLMLEVMAQASSFVFYPYARSLASEQPRMSIQTLLVGVDGFRLRKPVIPGDTLTIESTSMRRRDWLMTFDACVSTNEEQVAEATIFAKITLL